MSDSVRSQRWKPSRLPRPWDSPGENTGMGCHFLLQCLKVKSESEFIQWFIQSCPTLSDPMDCSLPDSSAQGIFQARVLEWVAIAFSIFAHYVDPFQSGPRGKEPACQCRSRRDAGSIPRSRRSSGGGHGNPIEYSCLENPMNRGAWLATVHKVTQGQTWLKQFCTHTSDVNNISPCLHHVNDWQVGRGIRKWLTARKGQIKAHS